MSHFLNKNAIRGRYLLITIYVNLVNKFKKNFKSKLIYNKFRRIN